MARDKGKWACKEVSTRADGSKFARWFASPWDASGVKGDSVISCNLHGGGLISQGNSSK